MCWGGDGGFTVTGLELSFAKFFTLSPAPVFGSSARLRCDKVSEREEREERAP